MAGTRGYKSPFGNQRFFKYSILNWDFETLSSKITTGMLEYFPMLLITKNVCNNASHNFSDRHWLFLSYLIFLLDNFQVS